MSGARAIRSAWVAWLMLLGFETLCQISLKSAGLDNPDFDFSLPAFAHALGTGWTWVAIACYIGAFGVWMTIRTLRAPAAGERRVTQRPGRADCFSPALLALS